MGGWRAEVFVHIGTVQDLDDHRRIFDGGDDLQSAAAVRAVFDADVG